MAHSWTALNTRSSSPRKMASSFQEEALQAGYVSAMTRACQQIDPLLVDYGNLASVKSLQASLDKTWMLAEFSRMDRFSIKLWGFELSL